MKKLQFRQSENAQQRSRNMRAIKSRSNKTTELRLRALLMRYRIKGWKLHPNSVPGAPDFLLEKLRVAIFVDGCFWHGCPRCGHVPKTNRAYWAAKITRNKSRDLRVTRKLREQGFRVLRIWECQLRISPEKCVSRILRCSKGRK